MSDSVRVERTQKTVLMLIFHFPPQAGGGIPRPLGFIRHLRVNGWEPVVITVQPRWLGILDNTLLRMVPDDVKVIRTFAWPLWLIPATFGRLGLSRLGHWLQKQFFPDNRTGWGPFARRAVKRLLERQHIDVLWTTSPPFSSAKLGMKLAEEFRIPWVADFRDNWLNNPSVQWQSEKQKQRASSSLRGWLKQSNFVTTVSEPFADEFRAHYDHPKRMAVLPNGFETFDTDDISPEQIRNEVFVLSFIGTFYAGRQPTALFEALQLLLQRESIVSGQIQVKFAGRNRVSIPEALSGIVSQLGYLEYKKARRVMLESSVLVLILNDELSGCISTKLPEYLVSRRYILGIVPGDGVASDLIRESGAGIVASPDNPEEIAQAILSLYKRWKSGEVRPVLNDEVIAQFSMGHLTAQLAKVLDRASLKKE